MKILIAHITWIPTSKKQGAIVPEMPQILSFGISFAQQPLLAPLKEVK